MSLLASFLLSCAHHCLSASMNNPPRLNMLQAAALEQRVGCTGGAVEGQWWCGCLGGACRVARGIEAHPGVCCTIRWDQGLRQRTLGRHETCMSSSLGLSLSCSDFMRDHDCSVHIQVGAVASSEAMLLCKHFHMKPKHEPQVCKRENISFSRQFTL